MVAAEADRKHELMLKDKLPSFGFFVPQDSLTNDQIELWAVVTPGGNILTADSILKRTGVRKRSIASPDQDTTFMAQKAVADMLISNRTTPKTADFIFTTVSYPTGVNISEAINSKFGLNAHRTRDVFAACSGFSRTLSEIKANEDRYVGKSVIIASTEKYSDTVFDLRNGIQNDPSLSQTIFSDGASAIGFVYGENLEVLSAREMKLPEDLSAAIKMPIDYSLLAGEIIVEAVPVSNSGKLEQDGKTVYRAVIKYIPDMVRETVAAANLLPSDIDLVIPHQGSGHVIDGLQDRLPDYRVFSDIEFGNFSSASIPKAMSAAIRQNRIGKGSIVVLPGFGAGLFAATVVIRL